MCRAPSGLVRAGGCASRPRPRRAGRPRTTHVVRHRDGQPACGVRQRLERAAVPGPAARRQHVASSALAGQLAEALGWLTSALHRCPEVSSLRTRALFAKAVLHLRRGDLEPMAGRGPRHHRGFAGPRCRRDGHRPRSGVDLPVDDTRLAERDASVDDGSVRRPGRSRWSSSAAATSRPSWRWRSGRSTMPGLCCTRRAPRSTDVPEASSPFFTTLDRVAAVVDDRGAVPLPVAEETMLLGRRRGRGPGARALGRGRRTHRAARRPDRSRARAARRRHRPVHRAGRHLRPRLRTRPARAHAAVGRRPDGGPAPASMPPSRSTDRLRDLRSIAMAVAGRSYVAALLGEATIARRHVHEAVSMMERTGDIAGVAHTLNIHGLIELELGAVDAAAAAARAGPAPGRPRGHADLRHRLGVPARGPPPPHPRRRRRIGSGRSRGGGTVRGARRSAGSASTAKRAQSGCRHDAVLNPIRRRTT